MNMDVSQRELDPMFDIWHIGIPVQNLEKSLEFYVTGLGFEFLGYYEKNLAFVRPPGKAFTIELMEFKKEEGSDLEKQPHHLAFECVDVEKFRADLLVRGYFHELPEVSPSNSGLRLFALRDPDGVLVQFYQGRAGFDQSIQHTATQYVNESIRAL